MLKYKVLKKVNGTTDTSRFSKYADALFYVEQDKLLDWVGEEPEAEYELWEKHDPIDDTWFTRKIYQFIDWFDYKRELG